MPQHKGGKKNRKHKRNREWCNKYKLRGQREKNKKLQLAKHLAKFPGDKKAYDTWRML